MKKLITFFCFVASMQIAFAQATNVDSILQKVAVEKDDNKKFDLLWNKDKNKSIGKNLFPS